MAMNEEYKLLKRINSLQSIRGQHTECISLYVSSTRNLYELQDQLKNEKNQSSNIKDKTNRSRVETGIEKILNVVKNLKPSSKGYCIFGNYENVFLFEPIYPNNLNKYICGKSYDLTHLKKIMYTKDNVYGLVALDGSESTIAKLTGGQLEILEQIDSEVKNRTIKGGQSARRYRNARDESLNYYYKEVSSYVNMHFDENIVKIYYGGNIPASEQYLNELPDVNPILKNKFSICYPIPFTDRFGIKCLLQKVLQNIEFSEYNKALSELTELQNKLKFAKVIDKTQNGIKQIYMSELVLDDIFLNDDIVENIPIKVYGTGHPVSNFLMDLYKGIVCLDF